MSLRAGATDAPAHAHTPSSLVWAFARRKPMGVLGAVIVCVLLLTAVFADRITEHKPEQVRRKPRFAAAHPADDPNQVITVDGLR